MKKIGVMGGTFNPIHIGHLILAQEALEQCNLDYVMFIPSGISYLKRNVEVLDANTRLDMVKLAIESNDKFEVSTIEINRPGNTYTVDTIKELKELYPNDSFYFITGDDSLFAMETWYHPEELFSNCTIITAIRDANSMKEIENKADELRNKYHANILLLNSSVIEISSSDIRKRHLNEQSIEYLVPEKVYHYILDHDLYRN